MQEEVRNNRANIDEFLMHPFKRGSEMSLSPGMMRVGAEEARKKDRANAERAIRTARATH